MTRGPPKVRELHALVQWAEGMVWSSPERHGAMTGLMKTQIDWIPLSVAPDAGQDALAVMQVSGGSQSFNAVNQMRVLGRWMRMLTIPNQSSVAKAYQEFDEDGRMKPRRTTTGSSTWSRNWSVHPAQRDAAPIWWTATASARKPPPPVAADAAGGPLNRPEPCRAAGGYAFPARSTRISLQMRGS